MASATKAERGWKSKVYRRTTKRRAQQERCGKKCFLQPGKGPGTRAKYPICAKNTCKVSCGGTQAAFNRARMQRNSRVKKAALRRAKRMGCEWARFY